jgi:hypothetical protein
MSKNEVNEKIKPLVLTDNETGDKYVLEFSRESVKFAEARGFSVEDSVKFPQTKIPDLFYFAFRKNHRNISRERTDRMLFDDLQGLPTAAIERLLMLYNEPLNALIRTDEDGKPKNAKVTVEL